MQKKIYLRSGYMNNNYFDNIVEISITELDEQKDTVFKTAIQRSVHSTWYTLLKDFVKLLKAYGYVFNEDDILIEDTPLSDYE